MFAVAEISKFKAICIYKNTYVATILRIYKMHCNLYVGPMDGGSGVF